MPNSMIPVGEFDILFLGLEQLPSKFQSLYLGFHGHGHQYSIQYYIIIISLPIK